MLQFSVYARVMRGDDAIEKHIERVLRHIPPAGNVRALSVTDMQFARMKFLVGTAEKTEQIAAQQLILL